MMELVKDGLNYYSSDNRFWLVRCLDGWDGWDVYEREDDEVYVYAFFVGSMEEFMMITKNSEGGDNYS